MNEFDHCPDIEELAALVDGVVSAERRELLLAHMDDCPSCFEVFTESLQVLEEVEAQEKGVPGRLIPFPAKVGIFGSIAAALLILVFNPFGTEELNPKIGTAPWWEARYDAAPSSEWTVRAQEVFQAVAAAADKREKPELMILDMEGERHALALDSNRVLISVEILNLCYDQVDPVLGDRRLAFIFGHELAHLDHGEHLHAFAATVNGAYPYEIKEKLRLGAPELQELEFRADRLGMLYAAMANYDPSSLVKKDRSFFEKWVEQPVVKIVYESHPNPKERAEALHWQLGYIALSLSNFYHGVELYQAGQLQDALFLFQQFYKDFPSREVANNLGLVHFQLAAREAHRAVWDFRLPVALDKETLAAASGFRGDGDIQPGATFQHHIEEAEKYFKEAERKDPQYLKVRQNQIALLILAEDFSGAIDQVNQFMESGFSGPELEHLYALAMYLYGEKQPAIEKMQALIDAIIKLTLIGLDASN